jgi:putative effector of murein hydrolase LrgA (UPF0299 family)
MISPIAGTAQPASAASATHGFLPQQPKSADLAGATGRRRLAAIPAALFILIACQLAGEALRVVFHLPIPGPVVGMFLLATGLAVSDGRTRREADAVSFSLDHTAETLIAHMGLLFVPAGVGIIAEADLLRQEWLPLAAALFGSTLLSLAVTGLVMHKITRRAEIGEKPQPRASLGASRTILP